MIRVYDNAGNVIETHEHKGEFKDRNMPKIFEHKAVKQSGARNGARANAKLRCAR